MTDVLVIGAGLAGLCAAVEVAQAGHLVEVLDAHGAGGRARTAEVDGFRLNVGPHAVYVGGALFAQLTELGIDVPGRTPPTDNGYLTVGEALHRLPGGPKSLLTTSALGVASKVRVAKLLASLPKLDTAPLVGKSVDAWLGDQPADLRRLLLALVRVSSYTDLPDRFDAAAAVTQIKMALTTGVRYIDGGWQTIVDGLGRFVESHGGAVHEHAQVTGLSSGAAGVVVHRADGSTHEARRVVIAAGGPDVIARLAGRPIAGADRLGPPVEAACLDLGLRRVPDRPFLLGGDRPLYLSLHAPTAALAPVGGALLSMMRYLEPGATAPDHATTRAELRALAALAGVRDDDIVTDRYLARLTVYHGVPLAATGGLAGRPTIDALGWDDVSIAGDWVGPEGMLADASAASGRAAGRRAMAGL